MNRHADRTPGRKASPRYTDTRRNFLKAVGTAAVGGLSSLVLPGAAPASHGPDRSANAPASILPDELYWWYVRSRFTIPADTIYMNTGTEGSMPRSVISSLDTRTRQFTENPTYCIGFDENLCLLQVKHREKAAAFLGADAKELVMSYNTTDGLHLAIFGLDFSPGDEIITTLHDDPYAASPLHILRDRNGITVKDLALPSPARSRQEIIDLFESAITPRTRAMCFCHINYTTGLRMPVRELCELARSNNIITIIDGAHSVGMIDFDLHDLGCDFYAGSGHKWLCGPPGTGIFYVRDAENNPHGLWPILTEAYGYSKFIPVTDVLQSRGQQNTPALAAMAEAMQFQESIGRQKIESRVLALHAYAKESVINNWGETNLLSPHGDDGLCSGLLSFIPSPDIEDRFTKKSSTVCRTLMEQHNTYARTVSFVDKAGDSARTCALRLSTHLYNSFQEIDRVIGTIQEIVDGM